MSTYYTDIASVQARTGKTYSGAELNYVTLLLSAVTNYIEGYTNRQFYEGASGDMLYDGRKGRELSIKDTLSVSAVKEYDSLGNLVVTLDPTDYELLPLNATAKNRIRLIQSAFAGYRYKVTGKLGYTATVPDDIKMVATEILANLLEQKGGIKQESIEGYSYAIGQVATENPVIKGVLDRYKKILI